MLLMKFLFDSCFKSLNEKLNSNVFMPFLDLLFFLKTFITFERFGKRVGKKLMTNADQVFHSFVRSYAIDRVWSVFFLLLRPHAHFAFQVCALRTCVCEFVCKCERERDIESVNETEREKKKERRRDRGRKKKRNKDIESVSVTEKEKERKKEGERERERNKEREK
jgi:hypothetical protein